MQVRYGITNPNRTVTKMTNAGMSCQPMNSQTARKWYDESNVPAGWTFFIDVANTETYEIPATSFLWFVISWKKVTKQTWQRIYERQNVPQY